MWLVHTVVVLDGHDPPLIGRAADSPGCGTWSSRWLTNEAGRCGWRANRASASRSCWAPGWPPRRGWGSSCSSPKPTNTCNASRCAFCSTGWASTPDRPTTAARTSPPCSGDRASPPWSPRPTCWRRRRSGCWRWSTSCARRHPWSSPSTTCTAPTSASHARTAYTQALEIYAGLDATWDITRMDSRLRAVGVRRGVRGPRRRPASGWAALTGSR